MSEGAFDYALRNYAEKGIELSQVCDGILFRGDRCPYIEVLGNHYVFESMPKNGRKIVLTYHKDFLRFGGMPDGEVSELKLMDENSDPHGLEKCFYNVKARKNRKIFSVMSLNEVPKSIPEWEEWMDILAQKLKA